MSKLQIKTVLIQVKLHIYYNSHQNILSSDLKTAISETVIHRIFNCKQFNLYPLYFCLINL